MLFGEPGSSCELAEHNVVLWDDSSKEAQVAIRQGYLFNPLIAEMSSAGKYSATW